MDLNQKNVKCLILGKSITPVVAGTITRYTDLVDGALAVVNQYGAVQSHGGGHTAGTTLRMAVRNGTQLLYSPFFRGNQVQFAKKKVNVIPENELKYLGYNMTSGSIEVNDDSYYSIRIYHKEADAIGQEANLYKYGVYTTLSSATQSQIAYGLTRSLIDNYKREAWKQIVFDRVYSGAVTGGTWTGNYLTWAVIKGSKFITSDEAHGISTVGTILSLAGLYFIVTGITSATVLELDIEWQHASGYVIWDDAAGASTLTTVKYSATATLNNAAEAPFNVAGTVVFFDAAGLFVSGVMANTTTSVTLDKPYMGTGAACALGGGTCAAGGNWGIRMEGLDRPFEVAKKPWSKVKFDVYFSINGNAAISTTVTNQVAAVEGSGTYQQIAELERVCQLNEGGKYQNDYLSNTFRAEALTAGNYNLISINYTDQDPTGSLGGAAASPQQIVIAIPEAPSAGAYVSTFIDALEAVLDDVMTFS